MYLYIVDVIQNILSWALQWTQQTKTNNIQWHKINKAKDHIVLSAVCELLRLYMS